MKHTEGERDRPTDRERHQVTELERDRNSK